MSDVYNTYIDENGYERWSSNDQLVYKKNERGRWQVSVLPKWALKKVRKNDDKSKRAK
jgi:hypothetical protein